MKRYQIVAIVLSLTMIWTTPVLAKLTGKRILVIHSYHLKHVSMPKRNQGLQNIFKAAPGVNVKYFYMDTKRKSSTAWKERVSRMALKEISAYKPDVIIPFDDNAQKYVATRYLNHDRPQIVFAGVNGEPDAYGYPASNATGILERTYPDQTLSLLSKIDPDIKQVVCLTDDSATSNGVIAYIASNRMPLEIKAFEQAGTFKEWKHLVLKYDKDPEVQAFLIPLYHTVKKSSGSNMRMEPAKVMEWTVKNITKPIGGLWPFATKDGALCAVTVDLTEHGRVSAEMALRVLNGEKAGDIPIIKNQDGYVILNNRSAKRLQVMIPFEILQVADRIIE